MVRFRKHKYAFTTDIEKMFHMMNIHPEQTCLQRILWKQGIGEPIKTYELTTVTYGIVSAPYLATKTLKQLAMDAANNFPLAAPVVLSDCYIDDILSGSESIEENREQQRPTSFTKRMVLSTIARIFDPLGLLGPIITWAKIFMQRLWLLELGWSDELPFKEEKEWHRFIDSLEAVNNISIDRCIVIHRAESLELHTFSDASEKAYGSSIYLKFISALGEVKVCLVTSKSRVSPLKQISIPRLELCGVVLAAKLMKVKEALNLQITAVHFWLDSTIVISWIHRESRELMTFVAKIHQLSSCVTSGITLHQNRILQMCYLEDYFLRSFVTTLYGGMVLSFYRIQGEKEGPLTTSEDDKGILRVGGRLEKASIPYSQKHPAILAKNSKLSKIYFITLHKKLFHVGPQGLLNVVRLRFWALGGRNLARKMVHTCVVCFKCKPIPSSEIMGNLPYERVNIAPPFSITGLDLGGPYFVTYKHQRRGVLNKIYVCVCICFVTRAIHLEILSDLTSDAIIATLKRFMSRRGKCSKIFTDNATNFVGANSQLKAFYKTLNFPDQNLAAYFTEEGIEWNFIPPRAPHMGGLWEAGIKSVKYHLKRALGRSRLIYEEFETVIIQVEGILNSRPLTPISNDFDNFEIKPLAENNKGNSGSLEKMEYRLSEYSPTERKVDDREGQCNVWYNGNCKGGFYTSLQLAFRVRH
ncbi:integrase catalytic domain-containing protein [Trichonephila clavipes]|nr:integrase catalytic domain-containing protein [Trichonephila clavipes]